MACFYNDKKTKDGKTYWCKECAKTKVKKYWDNNRLEISDRRRVRYHRHAKNYTVGWRLKNKDKIKEYGKAYRLLNKTKLRKREVIRYKKNKEKINIYCKEYSKKARIEKPELFKNREKRYKEKNPDKMRARWKLQRFVREGKIKKKPCEVCGICNVEAHHDDYKEPLAVRWLCRVHHNEFHAHRRSL